MTRPLIDKEHLERSRGFSLLELMVAMVIASVLMLLLVQFVQMASTAIISGEDSLYRTNDAQAALDLITTDLRSLKPISSLVTANGTYTDLQGNTVSTPPEILQSYNDTGGVTISPNGYVKAQSATLYPNRLYLLSNSSGSDGTGSGFPHLICYRVAWQDVLPNDSGNQPRLGLYRDYVSQDATFGSKFANTVSGFNQLGIVGLTDLYSKYWSVNSFYSGAPPVTDLLVGNVIDFQVYFYDIGSSTTKPLNPSTSVSTSQYIQSSANSEAGQVDLSANGLFINQRGSFTSTGSTATPYSSLVAEVKISVLTNKGVEIMNSGGLAITDTKLLEKYARTYVRRVPLALQ